MHETANLIFGNHVFSQLSKIEELMLHSMLNIAGIPRMSSVTIFQSDHFVLSTNLLFKFNVSLPLVTGELLQNTVDVNNVCLYVTLLTSTVF